MRTQRSPGAQTDRSTAGKSNSPPSDLAYAGMIKLNPQEPTEPDWSNRKAQYRVLNTEDQSMASIDSGDRATVFIHLYRAMVGRADIWRVRMDATTNWAIGTTAAVGSFALGNPTQPHYVVLIASLLTLCFLMLEARRLTFYHLWQNRVLQIEKGLIVPALHAPSTEGPRKRPFCPDLSLFVRMYPIGGAEKGPCFSYSPRDSGLFRKN